MLFDKRTKTLLLAQCFARSYVSSCFTLSFLSLFCYKHWILFPFTSSEIGSLKSEFSFYQFLCYSFSKSLEPMFKCFHAKRKIKCVLLFIGDEDYQLMYYSNIIQSSAILFEIVNHITSLFFYYQFSYVSFIIYYDFKIHVQI